jgi:hypothetical protein
LLHVLERAFRTENITRARERARVDDEASAHWTATARSDSDTIKCGRWERWWRRRWQQRAAFDDAFRSAIPPLCELKCNDRDRKVESIREREP